MKEEWIVTIVSVIIICTAAAVSIVIILSNENRTNTAAARQQGKWYVVLWNIRYGVKIELDFPNSMTLGRYNLYATAEDGQMIPEDVTVSREHVLLYDQNGALWVWNLSAVNPAKINGYRLNAPQQLQQGKRLELGNSVFLVTDVQYK